MKNFPTIMAVLLALSLVACSSNSPTSNPETTQPAASSTSTSSAGTNADLTKVNSEAMVTVEVTPLNFDDKSAVTMDFTVGLNTHSVDLNYDYKSIATLGNDVGDKVQAMTWDGPTSGGHHVRGTLKFPALKNRGRALTMTLRGIGGVPERAFTWTVN